MESGQKPNKVYKYVSLDLLEIILTEQTLKFSAPADFNDPFDCDADLLDFDFNGIINTQVTQEIEILKKQFKDDKRFQAKKNDTLFWQKVSKGAQIDKIKSSRISCFSLRNDIILMWSYYSNKHNGACLEFDNSSEKRFVNLIQLNISEGKVGYEAHQKINYVSEDRKYGIYKLFLNKSESWSHEEEYRMILINKPEIQQFYPNFLSAIYFGVKVTENQIKLFMNKFNIPDFSHLKYYKGVKDNLSIKFLPIKKMQ